MPYDDRFERLIAHVKEFEGGYVNHPLDRGGPTKFGVTIPFLAEYRGVEKKTLTARDIKTLTWDEAKAAYHANIWQRGGVYHLPDFLQPLMFNWMTATGRGTPSRFLQKRVGAMPDGAIGPKTGKATKLAVERAQSHRHFLNGFVDDIVRFLIRIAERDHTQIVFLRGWFNRFSTFYDHGY